MERPWLAHYDYWVPPTLTFPQRSLCEILDTTALEVPERVATAFLGAELTFAQIKAQSDKLALGLTAQGVVKGDRVGIMLPNCPQYMISAFAILRLGAVVVNMNPMYTLPETQILARDSGISVLITLDRLAPLALALRTSASVRLVVLTSLAEYSAAGDPPPRAPETVALADLISSASGELPNIPFAPTDLAVLQYTGGTTGTPKGAMLTHANIFANVV